MKERLTYYYSKSHPNMFIISTVVLLTCDRLNKVLFVYVELKYMNIIADVACNSVDYQIDRTCLLIFL